MKRVSFILGILYLAYTVYSFVVAIQFQRLYLASYGATFWDMPNNVIQYIAEKVVVPFGLSMLFFVLSRRERKLEGWRSGA